MRDDPQCDYPLDFGILSVDKLGQHPDEQNGENHHDDHGIEEKVSDAPLFSLSEVGGRLATHEFQRIRDLLHGGRLKELEPSTADLSVSTDIHAEWLEYIVLTGDFDDI